MGDNNDCMCGELYTSITCKDHFVMLAIQRGEKAVKNAKVLNICWKPLFAALMTGILIQTTQIHPILIGALLGIAAAISCCLEVNRLLRDKDL